MKTIVVFLFAFLLIISVNGNATEKGSIDLVSVSYSPFVIENYNMIPETISAPALNQRMHNIPEPVILLILGAGLVSLGVFARRKLEHM